MDKAIITRSTCLRESDGASHRWIWQAAADRGVIMLREQRLANTRSGCSRFPAQARGGTNLAGSGTLKGARVHSFDSATGIARPDVGTAVDSKAAASEGLSADMSLGSQDNGILPGPDSGLHAG
jgi:hypothetical protein